MLEAPAPAERRGVSSRGGHSQPRRSRPGEHDRVAVRIGDLQDACSPAGLSSTVLDAHRVQAAHLGITAMLASMREYMGVPHFLRTVHHTPNRTKPCTTSSSAPERLPEHQQVSHEVGQDRHVLSRRQCEELVSGTGTHDSGDDEGDDEEPSSDPEALQTLPRCWSIVHAGMRVPTTMTPASRNHSFTVVPAQ